MKVELSKEEGETGVSVCQMAIDAMERMATRTQNHHIKRATEQSINEAKMLQAKFRSVAAGQASTV